MEYFIIILISLCNGLFAMAEVALISCRKIRLEAKAKEGSWQAKMALKLASDPHKFLPTVQIGMTVMSIIAGAYGGTEVADHLSSQLSGFTVLGKYTEVVGYVITITLVTYLTLVVGELVPKTIGISQPERVAMLLAPLMQMLYYATSPFIWLLSVSTKGILKIFKFRKKDEPPVTEDELKQLIEQGRQYGILEKNESDMMRSIFHTADRYANSLMTHRTDIVWIEADATKEDLMKVIEESVHTIFPVCKKSLDEVIGIISIKDILVQAYSMQPINIKSLLKAPHYVPETMPALELLESFRKSGQHLSLVLNEYGSLEGIVTLHDVVEAIFGDIPLSSQSKDEVVQRADGSYLIDGMMQTQKWSSLLGIDNFTEDDSGNYNTLGGFIMNQLGKIPATGESFEFNGHSFEVVDMDGMRVDKVLVKKMRLSQKS